MQSRLHSLLLLLCTAAFKMLLCLQKACTLDGSTPTALIVKRLAGSPVGPIGFTSQAARDMAREAAAAAADRAARRAAAQRAPPELAFQSSPGARINPPQPHLQHTAATLPGAISPGAQSSPEAFSSRLQAGFPCRGATQLAPVPLAHQTPLCRGPKPSHTRLQRETPWCRSLRGSQ